MRYLFKYKVIKKIILLIILVFSHLLLSYNYFGGWWNSSLGTFTILFLSYLIWGKEFLLHIGLHLTTVTIVKTVLLTLILIVCAFLLMSFIAKKNSAEIFFTNWRDYYHDVFYTLNEEIIMGSLVLFALVSGKKINPIIACTGLAFIFSLIHYMFYRWIFLDRGIIQISTLITLFFIGFVRNSLILLKGHIGYSWALHFAWMAVMFGSTHVNTFTGKYFSEPVRFNLYLGSVEMLVVSLLLIIITSLYWYCKLKKP